MNMRGRWAEPLILAGAAIAGLACALLGGGPGKTLGDAMLALPFLAILRHLARAARRQDPR